MTEDIAPAEPEQPEDLEEAAESEENDDELYSIVTPGVAAGTPTGPPVAAPRGEGAVGTLHEIDFMHDVPLRLSVEIGHTHITVREILALNVGKVVEFTKVVGEPMDITISGRLMARGEIVVVNERYGVRISEVTRPDETETAAKETDGII